MPLARQCSDNRIAASFKFSCSLLAHEAADANASASADRADSSAQMALCEKPGYNADCVHASTNKKELIYWNGNVGSDCTFGDTSNNKSFKKYTKSSCKNKCITTKGCISYYLNSSTKTCYLKTAFTKADFRGSSISKCKDKCANTEGCTRWYIAGTRTCYIKGGWGTVQKGSIITVAGSEHPLHFSSPPTCN
jgi:hypothetical protein